MYLFGAGGHAKVIIDILKANGIIVEGIIDDNLEVKSLLGYPVMHGNKVGISPLIISIGNNKIRRNITQKVQAAYGIAVHPSAIVSENSIINEGTVVMHGAIVQSCTTIGKHCIVNTGASIDHECVLGDFVHISPHCTLCGNVTIGEGTWLGAGTVVIPGIKIGKWCVIGAGSVVCKDIPDGVLALGNPCKVIKETE